MIDNNELIERLEDAAEEWSRHVVEDTAHETLGDSLTPHIKALRDALEAQAREIEGLKQQAKIWKMEADTQKATVREIYQLCTGSTGEPGDWNGAEPVRKLVDELAAIKAQEPVGEVKQKAGYAEGIFFVLWSKLVKPGDKLYAAPVAPAQPVNAELVEALKLENFAADGWANSFYNALQHVKNLRDGITDFDSVLKNLEQCEKDSQRDWQKSNARTALANAKAAPVQGVPDGWQPIETAPKGAHGYSWMMLAWGPEDDKCTGTGLHANGKFFAAASFYRLGQDRSFAFQEIQVQPTHWMPLPAAPPQEQKGGE